MPIEERTCPECGGEMLAERDDEYCIDCIHNDRVMSDGGQLVTDGGREKEFKPRAAHEMSDDPIVDSPTVGLFGREEPDGLNTTTTTTAVSRPPVEPSSIETVIACLECGEFYEQATDEWERCPVCGDPLYRFEEADGR